MNEVPPLPDLLAARGFLLRQAGIDPRALDRHRTRTDQRLALIDGRAEGCHPALQGARIVCVGDALCGGADDDAPASRHATFCASLLVGGDAARSLGALGLCQGATLINCAAVTPSMLDGSQPLAEVAADLAASLRHAVRLGCRTILFGVEIRSPRSPAWQSLRAAVDEARAAGAVVVLPAGNRPASWSDTPCSWEAALVVASIGSPGAPSAFSAAAYAGLGAVFAPGEQVPGAVEGDRTGLRSGTSFAAALVAGVLGLAEALRPGEAPGARVARLFPRPHRRLDAGMLLDSHLPTASRETAHATAHP